MIVLWRVCGSFEPLTPTETGFTSILSHFVKAFLLQLLYMFTHSSTVFSDLKLVKL